MIAKSTMGTPEQIVAQIERLSALGVDGMLLSWLDYLGECQQWIDDVLPLMEQGSCRPLIHAVFPLEQAAQAHALMGDARRTFEAAGDRG